MYADVLPYLACPTCQTTLEPLSLAHNNTGEIIQGQLFCGSCHAHYPIREGIADFLGAAQPRTPAQLVNELPLTAWAYERLWRPFALSLLSGESFGYERELPLMARLIEPERGGLWLDIACSNGLYARTLTRAIGTQPGHVLGIDHSWAFVSEARRVALHANLRISYVRASAQALPVATYTARGAVIGGSLNEIGDLDGCFAEISRTLTDDGRFLSMSLTTAKTQPGQLIQVLLAPGGIMFLTPEELAEKAAYHDLRTVARWQYGIVLFWLCIPTR